MSCFDGKFGEEIGTDQIGGTIMLAAAMKDQRDVIGRIEYVEVTEMGQVGEP